MHPAEEITAQPWPGMTQAAAAHDPTSEKRQMQEKKQVACPKLSITISAPDGQVCRDCAGKLSFNATLIYERTPVDEELPIVAKLFRDTKGPLDIETSTSMGHYQIFTQPDCNQASRARYLTSYNLGRARGPDGRYLPLPDMTEEVTDANGWTELQVGCRVVRDLVLDVEGHKAWREDLVRGQSYWLAYAPPEQHPWQRAQVSIWRFGTFEVGYSYLASVTSVLVSNNGAADCMMQSWKGKKVDLNTGQDLSWMPIPLGKSNAIEFKY